MNQYKRIKFENTHELNEILIAFLDVIAFDSYEENENELIAYIKNEDFDETTLKDTLASIPSLSGLAYRVTNLENKNWNQEWESNFKPITIDNKCTIRASFHPKSNTQYQIEIEPKMAFGTGHHATTAMMISLMLDLDFETKTVLDFGTGTGILSILAEKMGAKSIFANDIEEPAFENVNVNTKLNKCKKIDNNLGGVEVLPQKTFDIILANVNTVALSLYLKDLKKHMQQNSLLMLSGILIEQKNTILDIAARLNLELIKTKEQNKWTALLFTSKA